MKWWLSFADDTGFLGVSIVEAPDIIAACRKAWRLGCNPGGEVRGYVIEDLDSPESQLPTGRLLSKKDLGYKQEVDDEETSKDSSTGIRRGPVS